MPETEKLNRSRAAERERVLLNATIVCAEGSHPVRVRDLSRFGAQVVTGRSLPSGVDAIFKCGDVFAAALIVWANGTQAGLQFYRELDLNY